MQALSGFASLDVFADLFLPLVILFAPLFSGGATTPALSAIEGLSILAAFIFLASTLLKNKISLVRLNLMPLALFLALVIFQLFPLPGQIVDLLSPGAASLFREFSYSAGPYFRLTICPEASIKMLLQALSYFLLFFVAVNCLDNEGRVKRLMIIIIIGGFILSIYGIVNVTNVLGHETRSATFANKNHFAAYLEMIIPLAVALAFISKQKALRLIFIFASSIMSFSLFLTSSRVGVFCLLASFILMFFILRFKFNSKGLIGVLLAFILISSVFLLSDDTNPAVTTTLGRFSSLSSPLKAYGGRFDIIKDSAMIAKDFLVFGTGLGTFGNIYQKYSTINKEESYYLYGNYFAHNEPVQLLVETGLAGLMLILLFLYSLFKDSLRVWLTRRNPFVVFGGAGCFVGIFAALLHSLFDFTMHAPANAVLFFVLLAMLYRIVRFPGSGDSKERLERIDLKLDNSAKVILISVLLFGFIFAESIILRRYQAVGLARETNNYKKASSSPDMLKKMLAFKKDIKNIGLAISLNPLSGEYHKYKADMLKKAVLDKGLGSNLEVLGFGASGEEYLASAVGSYKAAISLDPANAVFHFDLGGLFDLLNQKELALREYEKALGLFPANYKIKKFIDDYTGLNSS